MHKELAKQIKIEDIFPPKEPLEVVRKICATLLAKRKILFICLAALVALF